MSMLAVALMAVVTGTQATWWQLFSGEGEPPFLGNGRWKDETFSTRLAVLTFYIPYHSLLFFA